MINAREFFGIRAMISNLNTRPFLNMFKIYFKETLTGTICVFPKSKFVISGDSYAYGELNNPRINGRFNIRNLNIPELLVKVRDITADIDNKNLKININDVDANGSDFKVDIRTTIDDIAQSRLLRDKTH